jgi:hypothetical protein
MALSGAASVDRENIDVSQQRGTARQPTYNALKSLRNLIFKGFGALGESPSLASWLTKWLEKRLQTNVRWHLLDLYKAPSPDYPEGPMRRRNPLGELE